MQTIDNAQQQQSGASSSSSWLRTDCHELYHEHIMSDKAVRVGKRGRMLRFSINQAWLVLSKYPHAQVLEFGVHTGRDLCLIDRMVRQKESEKQRSNNSTNTNTNTTRNNNIIIHGFDSFRGLPEDWDNGKEGYDQGKFDLDGVPPDLKEVRQYLNSKTKDRDTYSPLNKLGLPDTNIEDNVMLHIGWFEDTVSKFFDQYPHPIAYCHADADLYSSTITFLEEMCSRQLLVKGSVITFDEYANYPNWQEGEYKAWIEMVDKYQINFRYICYHAPSATMMESQGGSKSSSKTYNKSYNKHGYQSVSVVVTHVPW